LAFAGFGVSGGWLSCKLRGASRRDSFALSVGEDDSMRPKERRERGQTDLFRGRLEQIVNMGHPLAKLGRAVDWRFLEERSKSPP
jgi:hypothetical protein